jgi:hypothetical protein
VIPQPKTGSLRPAYVSASTKSASVTVTPNGGSAGAPTVVNCTNVCSGTLNAPIGSDTFAVNLYDAQNGTGNLLSTGSVTQAIVIDQSNSVNVTFNGVVKSLAISLGASATAGTASSVPVTVNALDADGNTIVGPGNYVDAHGNPVTITLSDSDTSGATSLSQTSITAPASGITLNYSGLAIAPATIAASATGFTRVNTSFAPTLQPIVVTIRDSLNPNFAGVDLYAVTGIGSSATFTASEAGWTNAPFNKSLTVTASSGCANIGSIAQSGNSFTATVASSPSAGTCTASISDSSGQSQTVTLAYTRFDYTGASQSITVPSGVTQATITAAGAAGGNGGQAAGGLGGTMAATLPLTTGSSLDVEVGGAGGDSPLGAGGYNGGGTSDSTAMGPPGGAGGGGASDVRSGGSAVSNRIIVAGGGGGAGFADPGASGGAGGSPYVGGKAADGTTTIDFVIKGGFGGDSTGGGPGGGSCTGLPNGGNGSLGSGGEASSGGAPSAFGGGGGGGYYGGGAGGSDTPGCTVPFPPEGAGGGGGSSYPISGTGITATQGTNSGNGYVIIQW